MEPLIIAILSLALLLSFFVSRAHTALFPHQSRRNGAGGRRISNHSISYFLLCLFELHGTIDLSLGGGGGWCVLHSHRNWCRQALTYIKSSLGTLTTVVAGNANLRVGGRSLSPLLSPVTIGADHRVLVHYRRDNMKQNQSS